MIPGTWYDDAYPSFSCTSYCMANIYLRAGTFRLARETPTNTFGREGMGGAISSVAGTVDARDCAAVGARSLETEDAWNSCK